MYEQDISGCLRATIGGNGVEPDMLAQYTQLLIPAIEKYAALKGTGKLALLDQPSRTDDLALIAEHAEHIRKHFKTLIVFGTGGSSLGGQMLVELKQSLFRSSETKVIFVDNIDPHTLTEMLDSLSLPDSFFLSISKSGDTAETLAQTLATLQRLKTTAPDAPSRQMLFITEPTDNGLRRIATLHNIKLIDHPPTLGGRFSVLSAVGLLPAAVAGVDIKSVRLGAQKVLQDCFEKSRTDSAPVQGAALHAAVIQLGKFVNVVMPYSDRLRLFGAWYKQLWAESLGKQGKGSTAVRAVGAVDQHSQLQLYLDGPRDKLITLIQLGNEGQGPRIEIPAGDSALAYLDKRTIGDLLSAQQRATAETLTHNHCPLRLIRLKSLDEENLGALIMHFMLETIFTAELMHVNAFDQPAVEESKCLARQYLAQSKA